MSIASPTNRWAGRRAGPEASEGKVLALAPRVGEAERQAFVDGQIHPADRSRVCAYLARHPDERERLDAFHRQNLGLQALFTRPERSAPVTLARQRRELARSVSLSIARHLAFEVTILAAGVLAAGLALWIVCD